ncbi:MAG: hypothetical protein KBD66_01570 [Candidatus Doudnabacteria bacterium]|nr:hypothetical protein [Candidatus Doudnabacteria bacterium]
MELSPYHTKYASLPDAEVGRRIQEKRAELDAVFALVPPEVSTVEPRVAVLGCGDKRFVSAHRSMFSELLHTSVALTTFDIAIDHLQGEAGVVQHDCTLPLPGGPYLITYGHVLLKFMQAEKQWEVIRNSVDALQSGGVAIHVLDSEEIASVNPVLPNGQFAVPLSRWQTELGVLGYQNWTVAVRYGVVLVARQ